MKKTPFFQQHLDLGARMAPFAGYEMPIQYTGIVEEHLAVRGRAGLFDVSHMGEFILKGPEALPLLQRVTSNDAARLEAAGVQYSCLVNERGGIVDDLLVYCLEPGQVYMLVVNAANTAKDWAWLEKYNTEGAEMHDISDRTALLALQGPLATRILQPLTDISVGSMKYYSAAKGSVAGVGNVLVSATGYTGAGGVEIYFEDSGDNAARVWSAIMEAGAAHGLQPAGLGARDTLRLEMGYCLYGNDIDDDTTPLEAGLGWITKFSKAFTGREVLEKQKAEGVSRKLVGFRVTDRGIARQGCPLMDPGGRPVGRVTSGTQSPSLGFAIGLGYVETALAAPGSELLVGVRDKKLRAQVCRLPFGPAE